VQAACAGFAAVSAVRVCLLVCIALTALHSACDLPYSVAQQPNYVDCAAPPPLLPPFHAGAANGAANGTAVQQIRLACGLPCVLMGMTQAEAEADPGKAWALYYQHGECQGNVCVNTCTYSWSNTAQLPTAVPCACQHLLPPSTHPTTLLVAASPVRCSSQSFIIQSIFHAFMHSCILCGSTNPNIKCDRAKDVGGSVCRTCCGALGGCRLDTHQPRARVLQSQQPEPTQQALQVRALLQQCMQAPNCHAHPSRQHVGGLLVLWCTGILVAAPTTSPAISTSLETFG
jgi:hypothetical protein